MISNRLFAVSLLLFASGAAPAAAQMTGAQILQDYESASAPKALAIAPNNHMGYATSRSVSTLTQAKSLAMDYCKAAGGVGCRVTKSQGK